jgi:3-hydroxybutyryl-CoA dehydratase
MTATLRADPPAPLPRAYLDELHGLYLEDLKVGMTAVYAKTVTEADIVMFAGVSGDTNPVHLDAHFADQTSFKGRIAHGMLSAASHGHRHSCRTGAIYLSQNLKFKAPVRAKTRCWRPTICRNHPG